MPAPPPDSSPAAARALALHARYRGKVQTLAKCPVSRLEDFAIWYTPGVAAPCLAIKAAPAEVYTHTNKGNLIAIVSNGSRVLGLGDIGPEAGLPVMEGKALLFKYLGGVDAVPLCIRAPAADDLLRTLYAIAPSFGAINLEDISQPTCFRVLEAARAQLDIPVWHDDQQGSATAVLAGLWNALEIVGKRLADVRIVLVGVGAANVATYRLLTRAGVSPAAVIACDSRGTLHPGRADIERNQDVYREKWAACLQANGDRLVGGVEDALRGADVCIAFSCPGPGVIRPEWLKRMNDNAIVFACANPVPEIWPDDAKAAGVAIVATGRSDMPNQVNNALVFPGLFRGVLDVRARAISDELALAAARALAAAMPRSQLAPTQILPRLDDAALAVDVATAVGMAAQSQGLAGVAWTEPALRQHAARTIADARAATAVLMAEGLIAPLPDSAV
jgi:malate dehydrogenase (oxaloacetate-decarboxylating)